MDMSIASQIWSAVAATASAIAAFLSYKNYQNTLSLSKRKHEVDDAIEKWKGYLALADISSMPSELKKLSEELDKDEPDFSSFTPYSRRLMIARYEDVAILVYNGILSRELAFYTFARYALKTDTDAFWKGIAPDRVSSRTWGMYEWLLKQFRELESKYEFRLEHMSLKRM